MLDSDSHFKYEFVRLKALELFAVKGFWQVGMRELAKHLELSPGSFYNYFQGKQHLLFDLVEEFYDELIVELANFSFEKNGSLNVRKLIKLHVDFYRSKPLHFKVVRRDLGFLSESQKSYIHSLQSSYESKLKTIFLAGGLREGEAADLAVRAAAMVMNNLHLWMKEMHPDESIFKVGEVMINSALQSALIDA